MDALSQRISSVFHAERKTSTVPTNCPFDNKGIIARGLIPHLRDEHKMNEKDAALIYARAVVAAQK